MLKKQLIQKARSNGTTVAIINIKSTSEAINNLLAEENLLNKAYMSNSLLENDGKNSTLSMIVMDGDKPSAEFLRRKIDALVEQKYDTYGKYDIIYSYEVEGDMHEKDTYSR